MIAKGMLAPLILQGAFLVALVYMYRRSKKGSKMPELRKITGLDAMEEAVGRATELDHVCQRGVKTSA